MLTDEVKKKFKHIRDNFRLQHKSGEYYETDLIDELELACTEMVEGEKEKVYRNVGSWYKVPIRKGSKPMEVKGLGISEGGGCEVCGGSLVMIRGKHPKEPDRKVCPTCAVEIIESILDNCNNRQAYTEKAI